MSEKPIALITGGAGFIGSHLCGALLDRHYTVRCFDDLSYGSLDNIRHLSGDRSFEFIRGDVCDKAALSTAFEYVALIVHLAARKIPRYGDALSTLKINNEGTRNVFDLASGRGCKVVLASTSDVYGKGCPPFKESDDLVLGPSDIRRWAYAISKVFDEHLALAYYDEKKAPAVILRFFGSYGPRNHRTWWGGPQAVFIEQALNDEPLTVHGDGSQTRSFTYIDDLIAGIIAAAEKAEAVGQILNLGSDEEISILGLARTISRQIHPNREPDIKFVSYSSFGGRYEDVMRRIPDLAKSRKLLEFDWKVSLAEGLSRAIAWHRQVRP